MSPRKSTRSGPKGIERWRSRIDELDLELVKLLNERSHCAIEIGRIKEQHNIEIYDPKREKEVIRNVQKATQGPLSREAVRRLFERIIDETRRTEREARNAAPSGRKSTK